MTSSGSTMLELKSVSKSFGAVPAVRDVSLVASAGQVLGFLGPNGSGKSTTVKMAVGLLAPSRGSVWYRGVDIHTSILEHRRRVGYVPETPELYTYLTGPEYLELVGGLREFPQPILEEKIERLLTLFDLEGDRHAPLSAYSKGMKQKILISAALLHNPDIVILDEPSSGLDVTSTLVLKELIRALAADGKIVLYSSHVLELVEQVCSKVIILRDGKIVADGAVSRLKELAKQPSLEDVFTRIAVGRDVRQLANEVVDAMKL